MATKNSLVTSLTSAPEWFAQAAQDLKPRRCAWLHGLPALTLHAGGSLPGEAAGWILAAAAHIEAEAVVHDLIDQLKRRAAPGSLDAWTAAALGAWIVAGSPARDACLLEAVARFGGDATVRVLHEAIRRWTKDKQRLLALRGVDALGRIGSKAALEEAVTLTAGVRDRGVAQEARQLLTGKARPNGMSPEEMEDCHVADCGLDQRGERFFSYGSRRFRARVDGGLRLTLLDEDGRQRKLLPPIAASDERALALMARAEWSETKTDYARVLKAQTQRLEQAMVAGRSWTLREFRGALLTHPIVSRIARLLVWQTVEPQPQSFRVTEDLSFADARDEALSWDETVRVHAAHPLCLAPAERDRWKELLAEYRIVQPFQQLLRSTHVCDAAAAEEFYFPAPPHAALSPNVLYGVLYNDGWSLGKVEGVGNVTKSWKSFPAEGVTAMIAFTGFHPQAVSHAPPQTISHCGFYTGLTHWSQRNFSADLLKLGGVPMVAFSETVRRLLRLIANSSF